MVEGELKRRVNNVFPGGDYDYLSEVNFAAEALVRTVADSIEKGVALFIDYGFPEREYYNTQRTMGTLRCHYRHRFHGDPFFMPGLQDITAHVDFSAMARAAEQGGAEVYGYTTQAYFLISCGLAVLVSAGDPTMTLSKLKGTSAVHRLIGPSEMGELFKVIAFGKGMDGPILGMQAVDYAQSPQNRVYFATRRVAEELSRTGARVTRGWYGQLVRRTPEGGFEVVDRDRAAPPATVTDTELNRVINALAATLNDQRAERLDRERLQAIATETLGGEPRLTVMPGSRTSGRLFDAAGVEVARIRSTFCPWMRSFATFAACGGADWLSRWTIWTAYCFPPTCRPWANAFFAREITYPSGSPKPDVAPVIGLTKPTLIVSASAPSLRAQAEPA